MDNVKEPVFYIFSPNDLYMIYILLYVRCIRAMNYDYTSAGPKPINIYIHFFVQEYHKHLLRVL